MGPTTAMMIAVNIGNAQHGEAFVSQVAEQFKIQRTLAPTNTHMLLITIIGDLTAERFAARWREAVERDKIVRAFMLMMQKADVIQGTKAGKQLSQASLMIADEGTHKAKAKSWWKFW
jgi:hypothetical protein